MATTTLLQDIVKKQINQRGLRVFVCSFREQNSLFTQYISLHIAIAHSYMCVQSNKKTNRLLRQQTTMETVRLHLCYQATYEPTK